MANRLSRGNRNIRWIEEFCCVPEGRDVGKPVRLRPWQKKIIRQMYNRRTRRAIISFGRKNAKTTLSAFLLLLHLVGPEARPNSQLFSAAQSRDQAAILYALAAKIVRLSPDLHDCITIRESAKQLLCEELGTLYRALSAEASTAYGLSPVFVVHDELGQVKGPRSELYDALETAAGAQDEPLSVVISTQAPTDGDLLSILIDDAAAGHDPKTQLFLYTAPTDIDPFSKRAMKAANPALGDFLNEEEVQGQADDAKRMPAREASFRNLVLNQRVNQNSPFIPESVWKACGAPVDPAVFEGGKVYAGLDLSARNDLTALIYLGQDAAGQWHTGCEFWSPLNGLSDRSHRDRVPYDLWHQRGLLTATPGSSVDYAFVAHRLIELDRLTELVEVRFDRWRIDVLKAELAREGADLPLVPHGQGFRDMAPALDEVESMLLRREIRHGMHPILTNHASNAIAVQDPAGNRKLEKAKSFGRIDGMVAMAMAVAAIATHQAEPDISDFLAAPVKG